MTDVLDHLARLAADMPKCEPIRNSTAAADPRALLAEAGSLLAERGAAYGGIEDSFARAAAIASLKLNKPITAYDVATVLESVKDARKALNPGHRDSHIDGINYSAFRAAFALKGT